LSISFEEAEHLAALRQRAADKLAVGSPTSGRRASQLESLAVLHRLAASPETAGDAMALLHELQVQQVEVDLQQEELRRSQSELETALIRQTALVERAPVGYMTIDARTVLCEINLAGERLLGAARGDLLGRPLAGFLDPGSVDVLRSLLEATREGPVHETCELQLTPLAGMNRTVLAAADRDTTPERFLLVLMAPVIAQRRRPGV
jgi:PAS domain S-box-containing protein